MKGSGIMQGLWLYLAEWDGVKIDGLAINFHSGPFPFALHSDPLPFTPLPLNSAKSRNFPMKEFSQQNHNFLPTVMLGV